ncbi:EAL domain-containing protein [Pediococcus inopinatus]|uniref:EAL domain-containing protein n=2 Tax=Pediococcus inopinatus TaxID=114090 RepID=UPI000CFF0280|nr:EAL domain-containing protein [Pediococcus inopinatus]AVK99725.1 hypothetical protein PI20285_03255 [Pediococcus inopinatus]
MKIEDYCFFRQTCYDIRYDMVEGYELLMRERVDGQWQVPKSFRLMTPEFFATIVTDAMLHLPSKSQIMVNLDHDQFVDQGMLDALIDVHRKLPDYSLTLELTERDNTKTIMDVELLKSAMYATSKGLLLSFDDVGSGVNQFEILKPLFPYVAELKFALQNFEPEINVAYNKLAFWSQTANYLDKKFVLEGMETREDVIIAQQLDIKYGQGFYYDRPQKFY